MLEQVQAGGGHVVDVEELPPRRPGAPERDGRAIVGGSRPVVAERRPLRGVREGAFPGSRRRSARISSRAGGPSHALTSVSFCSFVVSRIHLCATASACGGESLSTRQAW